MSEYDILYYPRFEPNIAWLRSILLFVDSVSRIVPAEAEHSDGKAISELRESFSKESDTPDPVPTLAPTKEDLNHVYQSDRERMLSAFESLLSKLPENFRNNSKYIASNYNFVHRAKIPFEVEIFLRNESLITKPPDEVGPPPGPGYFFVQKHAGALILSYVADRIARRKGVDAVTDYKLGFAVNALEEARVPFKPPLGSAEGLLLSSIVRCEIPADLQYFSSDEYMQLRKRFSAIRETFRGLTRELAADRRLDRIEDMGELQAKVEGCAGAFIQKVEKYRTSKEAGEVKKWGPFAVGSILGVVFMPHGLIPLAPLAGKAVDIGFKAIDKVISKPSLKPQHDKAYQMLCGLQRDIISRSPVKSFLHLH